MTIDAQLQLEDVCFSYDRRPALDRLSLTIKAGEFVSLLGPSGAGKSTIFKLLTRAVSGHEGLILFNDRPLADAGHPFAFMPQADGLMPWRRVIDNAALGLGVQGMKRRDARRRVEQLIPEFGLEGFQTHYPHALSGGLRQRTALLRTVVQGRPILLLDEPLGALDALTRSRMQLWLEDMWLKHRWTVVLITHDVREAVTLSDRIYVLSQRPATVLAEFPVDLERPRRRDMSGRSKAAAIENSILDLLLFPQPSSQEGNRS